MAIREQIILSKAPAGRGYAYAVSFPAGDRTKLLELVAAFKECVPQSDRQWLPPRWLFRRKSLDAVSALVREYANRNGWLVNDTTQLRGSQASEMLVRIEQERKQACVDAFLGVLTRLPVNALILAAWLPEFLVFHLQKRVDEQMYRELRRSHFPDHQAQIPYLANLEGTERIVVPSTEELVAGLVFVPIATFSPIPIKYFQFVELACLTSYHDGVSHFQDAEGNRWVGAPYQAMISMQQDKTQQLLSPGMPYSVLLHEGEIYLVANVTSQLLTSWSWMDSQIYDWRERLSHPEWRYGDDKALLGMLHAYHLRDWFREWATALLLREDCTKEKGRSHRMLWEEPRSWRHPASGLIGYLVGHFCQETLSLLGWKSEADLVEYICSIQQQHATRHRSYCREHAIELARPLLQQKNKDELCKIAQAHGLLARPSWKKERLIEALSSPSDRRAVQIAWSVLEIPPDDFIEDTL